jgi:hypothetical protein
VSDEDVQPFSEDLEQCDAPQIVHDVLRSSGEPLDRPTRALMEAHFGVDFSSVNVHSDERAARSAEAVGAQAYSVGPELAFGRGLYQPTTSAGRRLLAHELAHVVQNEESAIPSSLRVGRPDEAAEHDAVEAASRVRTSTASGRAPLPHGRMSHNDRTPVLRRTTLGTILGGLGGALGGALIGGLVGGPIGALVGGAIGLVGGAIAGEVATTRSRSLTSEEIKYAKDVYVESVDYSQITITRDSVLALGAPRTIGNTIHLKSSWGHFKEDTLELTEKGRLTLIHEMGHVWQYQNGGLAYIPDSLWAQFKAAVSGGDRGAAYDWRAAHEAKIPWQDWNPEQQAKAIEDYNILLRKSKEGKASVEELHDLSTLLPYIEKVRRREGAPTFGGQPDHKGLFRQEVKGP